MAVANGSIDNNVLLTDTEGWKLLSKPVRVLLCAYGCIERSGDSLRSE